VSAKQHGIISRAQCLAVGLDDKQLARATREGGRWQRVLPGVYATFTGPLSQVCMVMAAALLGGPLAQVTGLVALAWYGCTYVPRTRHVDVLIPWRRRRRDCAHVRFHRTRTMPVARERNGVPLSTVDRAALLAARHLHDIDDVRAVLSEVVQRRLTTVDRLDAALAREPVAGSAVPRRVLEELAAGCRSVPEMWLRDLVLRRPRLAAGVLWNRRAALTAAGWTVLSVSPRRLREDPLGVLVQIEAVVMRAS
jgi:hypothetical protein